MDFIFQLLFYLENREISSFSGFVLMVSYVIIIILFGLLFIKNKIQVPKGLIWFLFAILVINVFGWMNATAKPSEIAKQLLGITFFSITIFSFLVYKNYDVIKVTKYYVNAAFVLSIIAIIQEFVLLIIPGINLPFFRMVGYGVDGPLPRVSSLFLEPAHFAFFLAPAVFLCFETLLNGNNRLLKRKRVFVILIAFIFTFSSSGFVVFFLLPLFFFKPRHFLYYSAFIIVLVFTITNVEIFKVRFEDTFNFFSNNSDISTVNLSTFSLVSNLAAAKINFLNNPFVGGGFGSHEERYMELFTSLSSWGDIALNYNDAGSLFLRIMSELGLFGLLFFLFFILHFKIKKKNVSRELKVINNMALMIFVVALLRNGHFFNYTFWVFVALYYYSYKIATRSNFVPVIETPAKSAKMQ